MEQEAQEAKAGGPWWPWPRPSAQPLQSGPLYPHQKKSMGQPGGIRSPPGLNKLEHCLKRPWSLSGQYTATAGWLVNTAAAGWRDHNRLA